MLNFLSLCGGVIVC